MAKNTLPTIYVHLLGMCSITCEGHSLRTTDSHSKKLWILLAYMLLHRNRELSSDELIDLLWEKKKSTNPASALKTLMHRLRKFLDPLEYPEPLVIPHHGSYAFNPVVPCQIDAESFIEYCKEADALTESLPQIAKLKSALGLYTGSFLPESRDSSWAASLSTQYHALYLHSVRLLIESLIQREAYAEAANLCWQALSYAPYEDDVHYYLIYSLYLSGSSQAALTQYNTSRDLFLSRFSRLPSERFLQLYKVITSGHNSIETDLALIQQTLSETTAQGSFFCEYETFKEIYHLENRVMKRTNDSFFLCLVTVIPTLPDNEFLSQSMLKLKGTILSHLRSCDIFCRYSASQYLLLISAPDMQTMNKILERITEQYHMNNAEASIEYAVRPLGTE
ncbi:MAG: winged helix-turn-helix domain-containing protein [Lachnospiraceae bacterium]|nr:winged helix-turn-helix domain-containing protein [Lachnospiraceae bacterium]